MLSTRAWTVFTSGSRRRGIGEKTIQSLLGSHLCLDFVTTQDPRLGEHPREFLAGYADLIRWGVHTKLLTEERALELSE